MHDINLKIVIALARSYSGLFSKIECNIQSFGLNPSEFGVLEMLYHKGPQPIQKVAEKILVTSGTITYVIDKLEKKELVLRKRCSEDKRIFYVMITDTGKQLMDDVFPRHKQFLDNLFSELSEEDKNDLIDSLYKLKKIL